MVKDLVNRGRGRVVGGWNGTLVVITHVWCQVDRTGEMELEIDGEERTHHSELSTNRRLCCARLRELGEAAKEGGP